MATGSPTKSRLKLKCDGRSLLREVGVNRDDVVYMAIVACAVLFIAGYAMGKGDGDSDCNRVIRESWGQHVG